MLGKNCNFGMHVFQLIMGSLSGFLVKPRVWFSLTPVQQSMVTSCCVEIGPDIAYGQWSEYEASLVQHRENLKQSLVLSSYINKLSGHRVKWLTDNHHVEHIVQASSGKMHLQSIALNSFETCFEYGICLDMEWISRSLNDKTDYVSHIIYFDIL